MVYVGNGPSFLAQLSLLEREKILQELQENLKFFKGGDLYSPQFTWFIIYEHKTLKAVIKTQSSLYATKEYPFKGINYVSVHKNFQGQGLARKLLEHLFSFYARDYLLATQFTEMGIVLARSMKELARHYCVYYVDQELLREFSENQFPSSLEELYKYY